MKKNIFLLFLLFIAFIIVMIYFQKNHNNNFNNFIYTDEGVNYYIKSNLPIKKVIKCITFSISISDFGDNSLNLFSNHISSIKDKNVDLLVFPQGFPQKTPIQLNSLMFKKITSKLKNSGRFVALTLNIINKNGKIIPTSFLFDRKGSIIGFYEKTHKFSCENIDLGNHTPVFQTEIGNISLQIGTDIFFWELSAIYRKKNANINIVSVAPLPVEDKSQFEMILKGRAIQQRSFFISSGYSNAPSHDFITNFTRYGATGSFIGGTNIINQNGDVLGSTGHYDGYAEANLIVLREASFNSDSTSGNKFRKLFSQIKNIPYSQQSLYAKNSEVIISIINQDLSNDVDKKFNNVLKQLIVAGERHSNFALMYEYSYRLENFLPQIKSIANKYKMYIILAAPIDLNRNVEGILIGRNGKVLGTYNKITQNIVFDSLPVFNTDFGKIAIRVCSDKNFPEIDRIYALKGANIIFNPDQSWGEGSSEILGRERISAFDNNVIYIRATHISSEMEHRSRVIDRYGVVIAQSQNISNNVVTYYLSLSDHPVYYDCESNDFLYSAKRMYKRIKGIKKQEWQNEFIPADNGSIGDEIFKNRRVDLYSFFW